MDDDGSGRIMFQELESFIRVTLKLGRKALSDAQMGALWLALDQDRSGFLCANDFGDFMILGAPEQGETWKQRLQKEKDAEGAAVRQHSQFVRPCWLDTTHCTSLLGHQHGNAVQIVYESKRLVM